MAETTLTHSGQTEQRPAGWQGITADWSSDQRAVSYTHLTLPTIYSV